MIRQFCPQDTSPFCLFNIFPTKRATYKTKTVLMPAYCCFTVPTCCMAKKMDRDEAFPSISRHNSRWNSQCRPMFHSCSTEESQAAKGTLQQQSESRYRLSPVVRSQAHQVTDPKRQAYSQYWWVNEQVGTLN